MTQPHPSHPAARPEHPDNAPPRARRWLNLGVLAHVDAGKTSLTEALLHAGGALERPGRVDDGTTQTDTSAIERRRGITVRAAVATFSRDDVTVNLVDTPGHPDFIAEVDRSLAVLDAAVLVVSAVEGVQAQTIVLFRALQRLAVPAVVFVNKVDRHGADPERVIAAVRRRLTPALVPLGTVRDQGTPGAAITPASWDDTRTAEQVTAQLAEHDDDLLRTWVDGGRPASAARLGQVLGRLTRSGTVHPVLLGSARTGVGVAPLISLLTELLATGSADPDGPASGQVFGVERAPGGDRVCLVRMRRGTLTVRDTVDLDQARRGTVTALEVHEPGGPAVRRDVVAGQVVRVHGLAAARIGDWIGDRPATAAEPSFPAPTLQTSVVARDPARGGDLHRALSELADVDPLIRLRPDDQQGALRIDVYGEVQREVIADTLAADHGIEVDFGPTRVICVETPASRASAVRRRGDPDHHPDYAMEVVVEPAPPGTGTELVVTADRASLPLHVYSTREGFRTAVLGYLGTPLAAGPSGWPVTDLRVVVTASGYQPPGPSPADVRRTTAVVVAEALARAGTVVCEPVDRFRLEMPEDTLTDVLGLLARHRAVPDAPRTAHGVTVVTGTIPTADIAAVRRRLPAAAHGEAVLESVLDHHRPGPRRTRSGRGS